MACDEGNSSPRRMVCGCRPDSIVLPLGSFLGPPRGNPGSEVKEIEEYYCADCFEGSLSSLRLRRLHATAAWRSVSVDARRAHESVSVRRPSMWV